MNDLITLEQNDIPALLSDEAKMEAVIAEIEKTALSEVSDTSTKQGRADITSLAYKVSKTKGPLKKVADDLKEDAQAVIRSVNGSKNVFDARMDTLRDKIKKPLIDWQEAEDKRVSNLEKSLAAVFQFEPDATSAGIEAQIENLKTACVEQRLWFEFAGAAQVAKKQMLETLRDKLELVRVQEKAAAEAEANRKELEELRAKQAEADKVREAAEAAAEEDRQAEYHKVEKARQAEAKIAQEARDKELADLRVEQAEKDEATAARQAEADKEAADLRAQNVRLQKEQKAHEAADAEAKRRKKAMADAETARKQADDAKANDAKLVAAGRKEAINAFYDKDMTEEMATEIVDLIIDEIIPHIRFVPES